MRKLTLCWLKQLLIIFINRTYQRRRQLRRGFLHERKTRLRSAIWLLMQTITSTENISLSIIISRSDRIHSGIRHAHLNSFLNSFFYCLVMTKSLPLGIDWVHTSTRKNITFSDKPLPINLVFIFLAGISTCYFKNFDEFSYSKSCSLTWGSSMSMFSRSWVYCIHIWRSILA